MTHQKFESQIKWTIPGCADLIDLHPEKLRSYVQNDYIQPDFPATGRGSKHYLSPKNAIQAKLLEYLVRQGVLKREAKEVVKHFDEYDPKRPYLHIFKKAGQIRVKWFAKVQQNKSEFEMLIVINVDDIVQSVNDNILKHGGAAIQLSG